MKLQFKLRGAWKDVLSIPDETSDSESAMEVIADSADGLLDACGSQAAWRIVDGPLVILQSDAYSSRTWYPFGRGIGA